MDNETSNKLKEFEAVFDTLVKDLEEHAKQNGFPEEALNWYKDVCFSCLQTFYPDAKIDQSLYHNVPGGKYTRGLSVPDSTSLLLSRPLKKSEYFFAATLGWLNEILQGFLLVADDIEDFSTLRRGKPCWYRMPSVGMIAINDAILLETSMYVLLKKHFRSHPCYVDMVELLHDVSFKTEIGQSCDLIFARKDNVDLNNFAPEKQSFTIIYKTAYYSFYLPVVLALYNLELATPLNLKYCENILIPLGEYYQNQDDYLDNFGSPEIIGKPQMDIQDNRCSWLIIQALKMASPEQRKVLDECYGRKDMKKVMKVKEVFNDLKLEQVYFDYERDIVERIKNLIDDVDESGGLKRSVFIAFLEKIHGRSR